MRSLYITEPTAQLGLDHGRLQVRVEQTVRREVPLRDLERVVLFGYASPTRAALGALLEQGTQLCLLSPQGRLIGRWVGLEAADVELRLAQYQATLDPARSLALARPLLVAKLRNSLRLLGRHLSDHPDPLLQPRRQRLRDALRAARQAPDLDRLRGQEGRGAAAWFAAFGRLCRGSLTFQRRRRHPPPDPVNALLSLGYSLVSSELTGALAALGLDPFLGFLHRPHRGRLSLALDLLEEFRTPVADRLTLHLVNHRRLGPRDFIPAPTGGVQLTAPALKRYLQAYEESVHRSFAYQGRRLTLRQAFHQQANALRHAIRDGAPYTGFTLP
ncbi:MAG: CRISPR-associated endonuclease Cas1 [Fimbriimonadaceae bacterium]|nr:CRISPR-associated endonuclease Cas1 [Fimbriimonadaceae bacterium]